MEAAGGQLITQKHINSNASGLLMERDEARGQELHVYVLKGKKAQPRILQPAKRSSRKEGKTKTFSDEG